MRVTVQVMTAVLLGLFATQVHADNIYGLKQGHAKVQSASALAFGPDGVLFIGDAQGGVIYAVETGDKRSSTAVPATVEAIDKELAKAMGADPESVKITDLVVNPETKNIYLAAQFGTQAPQIFRLTGGENGFTELDLSQVNFAVATLPNPAEDKEVTVGNRKRNNRGSAITDLAFVNGQLLVAGLSNDQAASNVWSLMFPFQDIDEGTALEIYHAAHGRSEDYAPIRTFVPFIVNGEPHVLAGFVCTPLVRFPLSQLTAASKEHEKVRGTTVAELGNRNQPLDMISYKKDNREYLLLANSARGVMKISTADIDRQDGLTTPVKDGNVAGQKYEKLDAWDGTVQLDKLDDTHAVVLIQKENGPATLKVVELP